MTRTWRERIFHVPHGTWYAIENSRVGIATAVLLGFLWIDLDSHVTKDGVIVIGHWNLILKDHFLLPDWFIAKYGKHPRVSQVLWEDLQTLRTGMKGYRGRRRRFRYISAARAMQLINARKRLGLALEVKADHAFHDKATFDRLERDRNSIGLPKSRMAVMTLQNIGQPLLRLKAAKAAGFTTILLAHGRKPANFEAEWAPYIDYVRGSWSR